MPLAPRQTGSALRHASGQWANGCRGLGSMLAPGLRSLPSLHAPIPWAGNSLHEGCPAPEMLQGPCS